jgi:hypothetical protein
MEEVNLTGIAPFIPAHLNEEQAIRHYFNSGFEHNACI